MNNGKAKKNTPVEFEESSGNVFRDLGLDEPELLLAKSKLIVKIRIAMEEDRLSDKAAATILGISTPDLSTMLRGDVEDRYSEKKLKGFLKALRNHTRDSQNGKRTPKTA